MPDKIHDVVIIGSGPAGYTAGIYTARANLKPVLFAGPQPGGQLTITTDVENFPGFSDGILGPQLMDEMRKQVERFDAQIVYDVVTKVDFSQRPFRVWVNEQEYKSKTVIISTGASAKLLGREDEKQLMGHGVSACATCDGFFYRNQEILVVGGGDSALEEATFLTKFASKVTIVHRRDEFRASKIMQDRALSHEKIEVAWNSVIEKIHDPEKKNVTGVTLRNVKTGELTDLPVTGIFIAIGHQPNTALFEGQLEMDDAGYILNKERTMTSIPGVFAAGDVVDKVYRQAITAAGMGCQAALDAERFIED
ncbi:thioredoxin-disulfide reductase [candidate division KSB1 bacterium]|nr:thioredoxin-disulfide reductase [candidate division KSB1 bacterium]